MRFSGEARRKEREKKRKEREKKSQKEGVEDTEKTPTCSLIPSRSRHHPPLTTLGLTRSMSFLWWMSAMSEARLGLLWKPKSIA